MSDSEQDKPWKFDPDDEAWNSTPTPRGKIKKPKRFIFISSFIGVLLIAFIVVNSWHLDEVVIRPAYASSSADIVKITGAQTYSSRGQIRVLSVFVDDKRISVWQHWYVKWFEPSRSLVSWKTVNGPDTPEQIRNLEIEGIKQAESAAKYVGETSAGCPVDHSGTGVLVARILKKSAADLAGFKVGDVIVQADGQQTDDAITLHKVLTDAKKEPTEDFVFERAGVEKTIHLTKRKNKDGSYQHNGIFVKTRDSSMTFPYEISFDTNDIGSSGGLAFTLQIVDQLTPGDITGGKDVSITGSMNELGQVGDIGGVKQKVIDAHKAGSTLMIVPKDEASLARKNAGSMKVVGVSTMSEALQALRDNGGDPVEKLTSCSSTT